MRESDGVVSGVVVTSHDVTARKQAEDEVRRLNAELEERVAARTAQLEATNRELEAFAYSVSHDLRAPLRAIDGFSAVLVEDAGARSTPLDAKHLERIRQRRSAWASSSTTSSSSRGLRARTSPCRASTSAAWPRGSSPSCARRSPHRRVETVVAPLMRAEADPTLLRVILVNLLENAWKFTSKHDQARIEVGVLEADGERAFFVRDDGAGFDPAYAGTSSGPSSACTRPGSSRGPASVWRPCSASSPVTAAASGPRPRSRRARRSTSRFRARLPEARPVLQHVRVTRLRAHASMGEPRRRTWARGEPAGPKQARTRSGSPKRAPEDPIVVGIGASAGGLEAFSRLLASLPEHTGMAFVLAAASRSQAPEPADPAALGQDGACPSPRPPTASRVAADHVYVVPAAVDLTIEDGRLRLTPRDQDGQPPSADRPLLPLAGDRCRRALHRRGPLGGRLGRRAGAGGDQVRGRPDLRPGPLLGRVLEHAVERDRRESGRLRAAARARSPSSWPASAPASTSAARLCRSA